MTSTRALQNDPVLAMLPTIRGRRVLRPCVLYARLGRGGMGAVYLGKHLTLRQRQVVKCLWLMGEGGAGDDVFVDRFHQEARIAAGMTHQNLVRVTHIDRLGDLHYLVMEHIEGEDVARLIRRAGRLDEASALALLHGAAQGLGYAHARGIVHRDVKPANLMLSTRGEVKVIDLGLARASHSRGQLAATIGTLGTPLYMAPEQWDSPTVGPTADVWALGASLYFALAGRCHVPDSIQEPSALRRFVTESPFPELDGSDLQVDAATRRILRRCVAQDPGERYPDARALAADLAALVGHDDALLAGRSRAPEVDGEEPDDDELLALQEELRRSSESAAPTPVSRATTPAPDDATLVFRPEAATVAQLRTPTPGPADPKPATTAASTAMPVGTAAPPRSRWALAAITTVAIGIAGAAGLILWPRFDPEVVQREAMAAIYQERYADADRLLVQLEGAPAFADQARRLRIDALLKEAQRVQGTQPFAALRRLQTAAEIAHRLLIPQDTDDALRRLSAVRAPLEAQLHGLLAQAVTVVEPAADARIVRARQPVVVRVAAGDVALSVSLTGRALVPGAESGTLRGEWSVPDRDGRHELSFLVEESTTHLQHPLSVPVEVRRGALALEVAPPAQPTRGAAIALTGVVHNGPAAVRACVVWPDGSEHDQDLGERDGSFAFAVPCGPGDGVHRVRLRTTDADQAIDSIACAVLVDRTPPQLTLEVTTAHSGAVTFVLRGNASETCRVFVRGSEDRAVATDAGLGFTLPLPLPTADGEVAFELGARDAAGNESAAPATLRVVVDRRAPHVDLQQLQFPQRTAGPRATITGRLDEPGMVTVGDEAPVATAADGTFAAVAELPVGAIEQQVRLRLAARDLAGNQAAAQTVDLFVDRCGPRILPAAPDGSWWADGRWMLRVEDPSGPCRVALGGETRTVGDDGRVEFPLQNHASAIAAVATDALGNESRRELVSPRPTDGSEAKAAPGPTWGTPVEGSTVDPDSNLFERVSLPIGERALVLRLVRPLRADELPPPAQRDPRAVALLQGHAPFYLSETEVPMAVWAEFDAADGDRATPHREFDPGTCQWSMHATADWRAPLHADLMAGTTVDLRERWPVTQVTPEQARAFCDRHGLRLPTENEWWSVARMGSRNRYGWGNLGALEQRANLADLSLQRKAPRLAAFEPVDDGFAALAPVDAFPRPGDEHPWGFRGLLGNAAEWVATARDRVVARGGSWLSEPRELRVDELRQDGLITGGAWDCIGFRVARDP